MEQGTEKENKIWIGDTLYRIIPHMGLLIDDRDPYHSIHYYQLQKSGSDFILSGELLGKEASKEQKNVRYRIPEEILNGYEENSDWVNDFNKTHGKRYGITLMGEEQLQNESSKDIEENSRVLPEMEIYGRKFVIDVGNEEVWIKGEWAGTIIPFYKMDKEPSGGYSFYLDADVLILGNNSDSTMEKYNFDEMVKLDPKGICLHYGLNAEELPNRDDQLPENLKLLKRRIIDGRLPEVRIGDRLYEVDIKRGELRDSGNPNNVVRLDYWKELVSRRFGFLYDIRTHQQAPQKDGAVTVTQDTRFVLLPDLIFMDPAAVAFGIEALPVKGALRPRQIRLKDRLEARILPLESINLRIDLGIRMVKHKVEKPGKGRKIN